MDASMASTPPMPMRFIQSRSRRMHHDGIGLQQPMTGNCGGADEHARGMKSARAHLFKGVDDDVLFAEHRTAGYGHAGMWLLQQGADDMQRVGEHLQLKRLEIG